MPSVGIHPPKTPVTKGSIGIAKATLPNVCKMPGPPAPFVPAPLPNIAKSGMSPKGYSKKVKIEGDAVAIRGATFNSMGDVASKGTGGGLISANTHGIAKFITPGSLTVKIEGKSVHLLGEPMLNNCGASGSPPNTGATMTGLDQGEQKKPKPMHVCGQVDSYSKLKRTGKAKPDFERDHVPSKAALFARAKNTPPKMNAGQTKRVKKCVEARGIAIVIPKPSHREFSPTCGSKKNNPAQIKKDSEDLNTAKNRDLAAMKEHLKDTDCEAAYNKAAKEVDEFDHEAMIKQCKKDCKNKRWW